jgi:hypothetical protein
MPNNSRKARRKLAEIQEEEENHATKEPKERKKPSARKVAKAL